MQSNVIRTDLLADYCGLYSANNCHWEEWVLGLSSDDLLLVRGRITQAFGRPEFDVTNNNTTNFLLSYLSALEQEFFEWAISSGELLDYFLASKSANLLDTSNNWHWQQEHKKAWLALGRTTEFAPHGIRVAPLLSDSLNIFLDKILEQYIPQLIEHIANSPEQRESCIAHLELLALTLFQSGNMEFDKVLMELKVGRDSNRASYQIDFQTILIDISKVSNLARSYNVTDLESYLNNLEDVISVRTALNTIVFWGREQEYNEIIKNILKNNHRMLASCGIPLVVNSESDQVITQIHVLSTKLLSQDYQENSKSINHVQAGLELQVSISNWNELVENFLRIEIDDACAKHDRFMDEVRRAGIDNLARDN